MAFWNHIASEMQVNRALRAPHDFLRPEIADHFRQLVIEDCSHALRLLDPVEGLHTAAIEWMKFPNNLIHRGNRGGGQEVWTYVRVFA